jgi:cysteine desulfurase / selenocysteine lyase
VTSILEAAARAAAELRQDLAPELPAFALGDRSWFPELEYEAALAHAAISPASVLVQRAVARAVADLGRQGARAFPIYEAQRERLRHKLCGLLGVPRPELALTAGTTRGLSDVALALPLTRKDEIVLLAEEFPANLTPWQLAAAAAGAKVTFLPAVDPLRADASAAYLDGVSARLRAGARYVAVSEVQFRTGLRMPIAALGRLCAERDAHLIVDAIQATGALPLDPVGAGVSALAGGGHKWLLGTEGAGYLYVAPRLQAELSVKTAGWLAHQEGDWFLFKGPGHLRADRPFKQDASVFEGSTLPLLALVALEAGMSPILELDPAAIFSHVQRYLDLVEPGVQALGLTSLRSPDAAGRSCILSFGLPPGVDITRLVPALRERGVLASLPDGLLRMAPHFYARLSEPDLVVSAVREALAVSR